MSNKRHRLAADTDATLMTDLAAQETPAFRRLTYRRLRRIFKQVRKGLRTRRRQFNKIVEEVFHFCGVELGIRTTLKRYLWSLIYNHSDDPRYDRVRLLTAMGL